jgi:hypothetical protein
MPAGKPWPGRTRPRKPASLQKQADFDYGDPDSIANYADAARSAALHQAEIANPWSDSNEAQARASNAASAIWRAAIEAALAKDELKPAIALHKHAADNLSPAECLEKLERGTTYGGADTFFSYRRCMRDCLQKKGDFDYLWPPKH